MNSCDAAAVCAEVRCRHGQSTGIPDNGDHQFSALNSEFTRSRIPVAQLGMKLPFRVIIDDFYREARRTADDGGAERTA
jgi:hypothetical protein